MANIFRAKIIDVSRETLTVAIFGDKEKTEALTGMLADFGILEIAKTGTIARPSLRRPSSWSPPAGRRTRRSRSPSGSWRGRGPGSRSIVMILINDEVQADVYKKDIAPNLTAGNMLMFDSPYQI